MPDRSVDRHRPFALLSVVDCYYASKTLLLLQSIRHGSTRRPDPGTHSRQRAVARTPRTNFRCMHSCMKEAKVLPSKSKSTILISRMPLPDVALYSTSYACMVCVCGTTYTLPTHDACMRSAGAAALGKKSEFSCDFGS